MSAKNPLNEPAAIDEVAETDGIRADLEEVHTRHAITLDAARPDAVARRRKTRQRTARENIDDTCHADTSGEHRPVLIAPRHDARSPLESATRLVVSRRVPAVK